jgi:hypothetical protein
MPDAKSLTDYIDSVKQSYSEILFTGGNLRPFILNHNEFNWVLFDIVLTPGSYRLCLMLINEWNLRPITAYAVVFPPGVKPIKHADSGQFGSGFNIPPAVSVGNTFLLSRNITDFYTRFEGTHQIGVTTKFWTSDIEDASFEVAVLQKNPPTNKN